MAGLSRRAFVSGVFKLSDYNELFVIPIRWNSSSTQRNHSDILTVLSKFKIQLKRKESLSIIYLKYRYLHVSVNLSIQYILNLYTKAKLAKKLHISFTDYQWHT